MHTYTPLHYAITLQEYEEDELLLVYDREYTYGENFYICLTVAAKERILNVSSIDQALSESYTTEQIDCFLILI